MYDEKTSIAKHERRNQKIKKNYTRQLKETKWLHYQSNDPSKLTKPMIFYLENEYLWERKICSRQSYISTDERKDKEKLKEFITLRTER